MTNEEILRDWTAAKDKKKQIDVLAQLNQTTREEIIGILRAQGVDGRTLPFKSRDKREAKPDTTLAQADPRKFVPVMVKPRRQHENERMTELFMAISATLTNGQDPPREWVEEFDELWMACSHRLLEWGDNT